MESLGFEIQLQQIAFNRFNLKECKLTVGDKEIKTFPFWFPVSSGSAGVEAQIAACSENDPISMSCKIVYYDMPGLQSNANVAEAISKDAVAKVLIDGVSVPYSSAYNVIGKLNNKADKWVIVTTPISGLFTCNAERGGGAGLFLELAGIVKTWDKDVNYLFMGNTGHELNFMGSQYSDLYAPAPSEVKVCVHFGSGIAATEAVIANYKFFSFSEDIEQQATEAFKDVSEIVIQNDQENSCKVSWAHLLAFERLREYPLLVGCQDYLVCKSDQMKTLFSSYHKTQYDTAAESPKLQPFLYTAHVYF